VPFIVLGTVRSNACKFRSLKTSPLNDVLCIPGPLLQLGVITNCQFKNLAERTTTSARAVTAYILLTQELERLPPSLLPNPPVSSRFGGAHVHLGSVAVAISALDTRNLNTNPLLSNCVPSIQLHH
jgi:hypothetical protein